MSIKRTFKHQISQFFPPGSFPPNLVQVFLSINRIVFSNRQLASTYLKNAPVPKLQIGSRDQFLPGWLNTDLDPAKDIMAMDATKRFPFENNTFQYVFTEHCIEHFEYHVSAQIIGECNRVLKPGGRIRVSTPDLSFLIKLCGEPKTELEKRFIVWFIDEFVSGPKDYSGTFIINNSYGIFGHKFIYDYRTLESLLKKCGFTNVERYNPGESSDENLRGIERHGSAIGHEDFNKLESVVVEAIKPLHV